METLLLQMERKCIHSVSVQTPNGEEFFCYYLLAYTVVVLVFGFFFVVIIFSLLITFGNWDNFWQPLVIVKSFIRIHIEVLRDLPKMWEKNWKE